MALLVFVLDLTSFIQHSTSHPNLLIVDQAAMVNYLICSFYIGFAYKVSPKIISLGAVTVIYSAYAYIIGKKYGTFVLSNDITVRTFYHSLMHVSTSSVVYFAIEEANAST